MELAKLDRPDLLDPPFVPALPPELAEPEGSDLFAMIRDRDLLLHHPFDSFEPIVRLLWQAAHDPDVLAIKMTLYRVGRNSPIVEALLDAAREGKEVTVLVELKARFDEESNIEWAKALEAEGVHVVYGLLGLKVHSKLLLVVRRERKGLRRYLHVGTGNYNSVTARLYTDLGVLTDDQEMAAEVAEVFNYITGYGLPESYPALSVAPHELRIGPRRARSSARSRTPRQGRVGAPHLQDELARRPEDDPAALPAPPRRVSRSTSSCAASAACGRGFPA